MASRWAAYAGASSSSRASISGVPSEEARAKKAVSTRFSSLPLRSRATTVLSNEGSAGSPVIAATSASWAAAPASNAGR
jgi:hypothetical protein